MSDRIFDTPLLAPDSGLNEHDRQLVETIVAKERAKALSLPTDDPLDPKRRKRVEFTWTEIWEQPEIVQKNLELERGNIAETAEFLSNRPIDRIYMTGCGDSIASMIGVRNVFEELLGIQCEAVQALDFAYYYHKPVNDRTLVIMLSSSGATVRTVEAMLVARSKGAMTLTLSNTPGSALMAESSRGLMIHAERKGWPTQSSTAAMAILYQLGIELARNRGASSGLLQKHESELLGIPEKIATTLTNTNDGIHEVAEQDAGRSMYLFAGGGPAYACASFGSAKIKECTPDFALAIPLEEFHHYNSQKAGDPLFLVAPDGLCLSRAMDTAKEGRRWGGLIYSVVNERNSAFDHVSDRVFKVADVSENLSPFIHTLPLQLYAYHVAMAKFHEAEQLKK